MPGSVEQLRGLANISAFDWNVSWMDRCSVGGGGVGPLVGRLVFSAFGGDCSRSWVVSEHYALKVFEKVRALVQTGVCERRSHSYHCLEIMVGEVAAPLELWTPIMSVPIVFHGDVGGTRET